MDSTTQLAQIEPSQAQKEVTANGLFDAVSPSASYGRHAETCSGLTWGYYGTRYGGDLIASGTYLCNASETSYMMVNLTTGVVAFSNEGSDSDPDWNNPDYGRAYIITTGPSSVTSYQDHRFGPRGIMHAAATAGLTIGVDVQAYDADLTAIAALTATTDNFMQAKASAWASRTPAQVITDLQGTGLDVDAVGFRGIPQNAQTGNYTTVAADAGKHLYHASGAGAGDTYTIDSNTNVTYEIGTAITFVNMDSNTLAIAITSDTLYLAGAGTTGTRTLAQYGIATALKLTSTTWLISGTGLT